MNQKYQKIWKEAVKYLQGEIRKDYVVHTEGVVKAMEMLLKKEKGDPDILIPSAMLHDVGWHNVPKLIQAGKDKKSQREGIRMHIKYAGPNARKILQKIGYPENKIKNIASIVMAHKSKPKQTEKRLLIDADALSDVFSKQFKSDIKAYKTTAQKLHNFRNKNTFYTKTAEAIFIKELEKRKIEYKLHN